MGRLRVSAPIGGLIDLGVPIVYTIHSKSQSLDNIPKMNKPAYRQIMNNAMVGKKYPNISHNVIILFRLADKLFSLLPPTSPEKTKENERHLLVERREKEKCKKEKTVTLFREPSVSVFDAIVAKEKPFQQRANLSIAPLLEEFLSSVCWLERISNIYNTNKSPIFLSSGIITST